MSGVNFNSTTQKAAIVNNNEIRICSATDGITASTNQNQGQCPLTSEMNEIDTATSNDVVTLPSADVGLRVTVINNSNSTIKIFPASGDDLGQGLNNSASLASNSVRTYFCYKDGFWKKSGEANGD